MKHKLFIVTLLLLLCASCVTKVQVVNIEVHDGELHLPSYWNINQTGSSAEDSLNGNEDLINGLP